jgi:hypothetical protein
VGQPCQSPSPELGYRRGRLALRGRCRLAVFNLLLNVSALVIVSYPNGVQYWGGFNQLSDSESAEAMRSTNISWRIIYWPGLSF